MRKTKFKSYLILLLGFFLFLSLPIGVINFFKQVSIALTKTPTPSDENNELMTLQLENQLLSHEIERLQSLLQQEQLIHNQSPQSQKDLQLLLQHQIISIPAKVIFRSPTHWESSFWIDVGENTNNLFKRKIIEKNSPVILGRSIVGVVEEVHSKKSRVRLITDPLLTPSVRVVRDTLFLAKGELQGSSTYKKRLKSNELKGSGFNYDFADQYGPARDLRTGTPINEQGKAVPIIDVDDLLITTGLDGIFPEGFHIAKVSKIIPLKEGDFYYDIEAYPTVGNLNNLSYVFILPPIEALTFETQTQ